MNYNKEDKEYVSYEWRRTHNEENNFNKTKIYHLERMRQNYIDNRDRYRDKRYEYWYNNKEKQIQSATNRYYWHKSWGGFRQKDRVNNLLNISLAVFQ